MSEMVGKEVGPYRILQKVAQGGMCAIYKGLHAGLEQEVAIKVLSPESFEDPCIRDRFINEAKIQARFSHPNVIKTLNYIEQDDTVYLVLEYVNGEPLDVLLKKTGALPADRATAIFMSVLEAIDFMHSKGIIHRDIKPANIMLSYDGFVKVMDFGIAKIMGETGKTRVGIRIGTLWYMSPEQIRGEEATILTDIYSLGATLYQMATGRVPFNGEMEFDIMRGHLEQEPTPPWKINRDVPKDLGTIILKALSKNPKERYQSAREFLEAVRSSARTYGETKIITQVPEDVSFWKKSLSSILPIKRWTAAVITTAVIVLFVLMGFIYQAKTDKPVPLKNNIQTPGSDQPAEASVKAAHMEKTEPKQEILPAKNEPNERNESPGAEPVGKRAASSKAAVAKKFNQVKPRKQEEPVEESSGWSIVK